LIGINTIQYDLLIIRYIGLLFWASVSGGSRHFEGMRKTTYQNLRYLSQMRIMKYTGFIREKVTYWENLLRGRDTAAVPSPT